MQSLTQVANEVNYMCSNIQPTHEPNYMQSPAAKQAVPENKAPLVSNVLPLHKFTTSPEELEKQIAKYEQSIIRETNSRDALKIPAILDELDRERAEDGLRKVRISGEILLG